MRQSTTLPVLLIVAGVCGALWCLDGLLVRGDLAWEESVVGFACWYLLAALGVQEIRSTNDFNETK
jgi:hypothetical protein